MSDSIDVDAILAEIPDVPDEGSPFPGGNLTSCGDPSCRCADLPTSSERTGRDAGRRPLPLQPGTEKRMIRDAARLLNAKLSMDPLVAQVTAAGSEDWALNEWWALFGVDVNTVDRAVNSLLYAGPRLSERNCSAAASMAETLLASLHKLECSGWLSEDAATAGGSR